MPWIDDHTGEPVFPFKMRLARAIKDPNTIFSVTTDNNFIVETLNGTVSGVFEKGTSFITIKDSADFTSTGLEPFQQDGSFITVKDT
jgi:hypothetical protein